MAHADLIDEYLAALRSSLRWRPDVDDLVCEADDHLRCATLQLAATGIDVTSAEREVLARFGDADVIARAFALTPSGGIAMPTRLTRTAGTFALLAAIGWFAVAPAALIGAGSDDWEVRYATLAMVTFVSAACSVVAVYGLLRRAGGGADAVTIVATGCAVLGALVLGIVTWMWLVGVALLTISAVVTVLRLRTAHAGGSAMKVLLAAAWPFGIAVAVVLDLLKVGPMDSYGDHFLGQLIGFASGAVIFGAGLLMAGTWLRGEEAAEVPDTMATV